ncbi:protein ITPRID1 [Hyperolius riggenbachi]|uniref:protein ITPRID1 n=1 Tax=Hyperolius riggenbachi TaxID=752182 RepID=UPI0035A2BFB4
MDLVDLNHSEVTKSLPGTQNMKQMELKMKNISQSLYGKGFVNRIGMMKLSVKDYMSNLHTSMEISPTAKRDGEVRPTTGIPKSISEMLKLYEADPVDLLIDLGFGIDEPDICTKIPIRFIMTPSGAGGINTRVFLDAQKRRMEIETPNLCGRFRQLEVLDQVTTAFSSLLHNVHVTQHCDGMSVKESTLTPERRKEIRQLLWKFARQAKLVDENAGTCTTTEEQRNKQDREPLKDTTNMEVFRNSSCGTYDHDNLDSSSADQSAVKDSGDALCLNEDTHLSTIPALVKQYSLPEMTGKVRTLRGAKLSKTFRITAAQNRLQAPDSFELEEVQSFEEDYPKSLNQDRLSEISRTNSCQSDSSGFQEEPPEPLPLQNRRESSDSLDSQATLHEKSNSSDFQDIQEDDLHHFSTPPGNAADISAGCNLQTKKYTFKSISMTTQNSEDIFKSFEADTHYTKSNTEEMDEQMTVLEDPKNETQDISADISYIQQDEPEKVSSDQQTASPVSPEPNYPVYVTHYLSDLRVSNVEITSEIKDSPEPDDSERCVSDLQDRSDSERDSFADDECSVELSDLKWTPSPTGDPQSFDDQIQTPQQSVDYSDDELQSCYQNQKTTFQTEICTNIYKSVTIQMSSSLLPDTGDCNTRQHSVHNTNNKNEWDAILAERKDAFSQTEIGLRNECYTNTRWSCQRNHSVTESPSLETGPLAHHHSSHPVLNVACCHCCYCHHCCMSRCPVIHKHNVPSSPNPARVNNIEKELTDTLSLLRESLINMSLNKDNEMVNMKRACQQYREKLVEIEQHLTEQQAVCYNVLSHEEREKIRRLHILRRTVLKEATELECNLDESARHVKETISMQLEKVLEEQSRLYSELELSSTEENGLVEGDGELQENGELHENQTVPSTLPPDVPEGDDPEAKSDSEEGSMQPQKMDISSVIENIKKAFMNFGNN